MNTKLLMVAYYYPPRGGGGTQRTVKFVKYLPDFGVEPTVLTSGTTDRKVADQTLAVSNRSVISVPHREFPAKLARAIEPLMLPDVFARWIKPAIAQGLTTVKECKISVIYSTAGPYTNHLVAQRIATITNLPWVADFRDLWTSNAIYTPRAPWQAQLHRRLEHRIYQAASHILTTSQTQREVTMHDFSVPASRISVITNGYDPQDFAVQKTIPRRHGRGDPLQIMYLGSLYERYRPDDLIEALAYLKQHDPATYQQLHFTFIGDYDRVSRMTLDNPRTRDAITVRPYVPHAELQKLRSGADAYLLYLPAVPGPIAAMIPQKVFEYLADRKPILAIVPPSDVRELLERTGGAHLVPAGNPDLIARGLTTFVEQLSVGRLTPSTVDLSEFSRTRTAAQLAELVQRLAKPK